MKMDEKMIQIGFILFTSSRVSRREADVCRILKSFFHGS